jgi:branched-chain amino acid transport system permease protein
MVRAFKNPLLAFVVVLLVGLIFQFAFDDYVQLMVLFITVNCLMALSLNLVNGFTGQFSLGHAGFMAIGAYFTAYASVNWHFLPESLQGIEFFIFAIGSGLVAGAAGFLVGLPSLRLKGDSWFRKYSGLF